MTISTLRLSMRPSSFCSLNRARSIAQYGVLLPLSRKHELEADQIGLTYMARAGYDLRESVAFWKRMMAASQGGKPPEFMLTHPADQTRISQLEQRCRLLSRSIKRLSSNESESSIVPPPPKRFMKSSTVPGIVSVGLRISIVPKRKLRWTKSLR